jgi:hypothetical protein
MVVSYQVDESTPLLVACRGGHTGVVRAMFAAGVARPPDLFALVTEACRFGHVKVLTELLAQLGDAGLAMEGAHGHLHGVRDHRASQQTFFCEIVIFEVPATAFPSTLRMFAVGVWEKRSGGLSS